jgi:hypothetical protein
MSFILFLFEADFDRGRPLYEKQVTCPIKKRGKGDENFEGRRKGLIQGV